MRSILVLGMLVFCFAASATAQTALRIGDRAPEFDATSIDGTTVDLSSNRGSVVVLTFWSTRCEICRTELPKVDRLIERFANRNVVFLAFTMENEAKVTAYTNTNRVRATIVPNAFGVVLQYADRTREGNLDMGFPNYFVVDQTGRIAYRGSGFDRTASLAAVVDALSSR